MAIKILTFGKTNESFILNGLELFTNRIKHYTKFGYTELHVKYSNNKNPEAIRKSESEVLLKNIKPKDYLILLDELGTEMPSIKFAARVEKLLTNQQDDLIFVIGGAYGFNESIYDIANEKISLSKMTFTHQMARLIFMEQLYRAFTIIRNEKYHH